MVYDEEGNLRLELPGRGGSQSSSKLPVSSEDLTIIIDRKEPEEPAQTGTPGMPELPIDPLDPEVSGSVLLGETPLTDWAALREQLPGDVGGVCLTVKDEDGIVYVDSPSATKLSRRILSLKKTTEAAVADMTEEPDLVTIARITCLLDPKTPILDVRALGVRQKSGYLFYDETGASWLDPTKETVRNYLAGLVRECGKMGFDEILLTHVSYPTGGEVDQINYGSQPKEENLAEFLRAVRSALNGLDVRLALELPTEVIRQGKNEISGQDLRILAPLVDCVYAQTTAAEAEELADLVHTAAPGTAFVAMVRSADGITVDYLLVEE